MTTITIYKSKNGEYRRLACKGHSGYDTAGKDIVCASVSCLAINTINSLEALAHEKMEILSDEGQGLIDCHFQDTLSKEGILLMDSLVLGLKSIADRYGRKYLKLKFREV